MTTLTLGDELNYNGNRMVSRRKFHAWIVGTAIIFLLVGIGLGLLWAYQQRRCNEKIFPDNCVLYCADTHNYIQRKGE